MSIASVAPITPPRIWPDLSAVMRRLDPIPCRAAPPRWTAHTRLQLAGWLERNCAAESLASAPPEYRDLLAELAAYRERRARADAADLADWRQDERLDAIYRGGF